MASKQILDEIRSRLSIVSMIGERVPLKKSGRNFKGLCPFHQEKTPSLMVSEEKQIFHCFGCATGGDIFTFLMKMDNITFPEALEELAKKARVSLPKENKKETAGEAEESLRRKQWAFRLNQIALDFFVQNLKSEGGNAMRNYLSSRGIDPKTATQHFLGYVDKGGEDILNLLTASTAPLKLALELGLIKERESQSGYYDFFRGRLMFPIFDIKNRVVGFGGRTLEKETSAKYLNSQDSFLFHKSQLVYGLNWALDSIRTQDEVILVEGYLDLIALRQHGIENVAAPLGTALTMDHLRLLMRYTKNFCLAFDSDAAGIQAAIRSLTLFLELGLVPRALSLPAGQDPDNFIRQKGRQEWEKLKSKAKTLFEFFVDDCLQKIEKGTAATLGTWEKIRPILEQVTNPLEYGMYRKQIAEKLGVEESWLKTTDKSRVTSHESRVTRCPSTKLRAGEVQDYPEEERLLIAAMVLKPKVMDDLKENHDIFTNLQLKNVAEQLFEQYADKGNVSLASVGEILDNQLAGWIRELALLEDEDNVWEKVVRDCLEKIRSKTLGTRLTQLNQEIAFAESQGDEKTMLRLLTEKKQLMETRVRCTLR